MLFRFKWLKRGTPDFCVEYRDRLYFFMSASTMEKFLRQPQKYINISIPSKLPAKAQPRPVSHLTTKFIIRNFNFQSLDSNEEARFLRICLKNQCPMESLVFCKKYAYSTDICIKYMIMITLVCTCYILKILIQRAISTKICLALGFWSPGSTNNFTPGIDSTHH
jgi:YHS domain-containing protein